MWTMPNKVSTLLMAVCAEMRESDPIRARLETLVDRAILLEAHSEELTEDSRKMAKEMQGLRADVALAAQNLAAERRK